VTDGRPLILLVDDDADLRDALALSLELAGFAVHSVEGGMSALAALERESIAAVVTDIRMPGLDGRQLLQRILAIDAELPVILMTGHGDIEQAVTALRQGAYDYLAKPFASERLMESVRRAVDKRGLVLENRRLRSEMALRSSQPELPLIGSSPAVQRLVHTIGQLAGTGIDVLIEGEWGTGKQAVARMLGRRTDGGTTPVQLFDCEAAPQALVETLLFGPTGSERQRRSDNNRGGILGKASGGILLLAGVETLSPTVQTRLLHSLAHRDLGSGDGENDAAAGTASAPPRIVSTTTVRLMDRVADGRFRSDLYFRLAPVSLVIPPLRERRADIPMLFLQLLENAARHYQRPVPALSDAMMARLVDHDWPGNLRELQNHAEQAILNLDRAEERMGGGDHQSLPVRVARFEAEALRAALRAEGGRIGPSCARLGIPRKTLYDKLAKYGISATDFR
jgi:two-component system, NtrC family, C4-dicarboxylate transport response regulator DctD